MNTHANPGDKYVVFGLDEQRFALRLSAVERVVLAVEVTPLPRAPEIVLGVINVQGQITPVFDLRKRFGLPAREINLSDQFIVARTHRRQVALVVDEVRDVGESLAQQTVAADEILPGIGLVEGVAKLGGDLIFIHDLDKFLTPEEERGLEGVLEMPHS